MEPLQTDQVLLENIPNGYYVLDEKWRFIYINHRAAAYAKRHKETLVGDLIWDEFPTIVGTVVEQLLRKAAATKTMQALQPLAIKEMRTICILALPSKDRLHVYVFDAQSGKNADDVSNQLSDRKSFLLKLSDTIQHKTDPVEIQAEAIQALGAYLQADRAAYCNILTLENIKYCSVICSYQSSGEFTRSGVFPLSSLGRLAEGILEGRTTVVRDIKCDDRWGEKEQTLAEKLNARSWILAPIVKNGCLAAFICIHHFNPRWWTMEDLSLIEDAAERTWSAADKAQADIAVRGSRASALGLVKELEDANKNKNAFLSTLSHELRNPLAAISVGLDLVEAVENKDEAAGTIQIMKRQMKQLRHLVDDLLDLTRISNNRVQLKRENVELNQLARSAMEEVQLLFDQNKIKLRFIANDADVLLCADPVRVKQIICNLLHNAQKFTDENGEVALAVTKEAQEAVIRVSDNGIGIHPKVLPQLFKPFAQAESSLGRSGGLGLGLSIVKSIAELHGGTVSAHSEGLGKGSQFIIRLPLTGAQDVKACGGSTQKAEVKLLSLLFIDDQQDYAQLLMGLLKRQGHNCILAASGEQGLVLAKKHMPDAILCDIGMPRMDGYEVAKMIRKDTLLSKTPLIALTGYAGPQDEKAALEAGFARHLRKPIDMDTLNKVLSELCPASGK